MNTSGGLGALIAGGASIHYPDQGVMRIKNFDFVGSYSGVGQIALTNSTDDSKKGTFGMVFKKANPIWAVLAVLPQDALTSVLTGGGAEFGRLIDEALGRAANDNNITQNLREVA